MNTRLRTRYRYASRGKTWSLVLLLFVLLGQSLDVAAQRGRPYRPPTRPVTSIERDIYRAPTSQLKDEAFSGVRSPGGPPVSRFNPEGSKRAAFWQAATNSFGRPTASLGEAFVLLRVFDKGVAITTNFLQGGAADAPVLVLPHEQVADASQMSVALKTLLGTDTILESTRLKLVFDRDPALPEFSALFSKEDQSFIIPTNSFAHADLYLKDKSLVYSIDRIDRPSPPPRWAAKLNDCCVKTGVPPDLDGWARLGSVPFNKGKAQLVSLFSDSQTSDKFSSLPRSSNIRSPLELKGDALRAIESLINSGDPGSPVIVVGHTENSGFRVERPGGEHISFDELTRIAIAADRPVFFVGCYTADHFHSMADKSFIRDYIVSGTLNSLHPREVAPKVLDAINSSASLKEFTERLSDETLNVWISNNFLRSVAEGTARTIRAPIYKKTSDGRASIVGFIFVYLPCKFFGGC
ncbi:hypothetical protein EV672_103154 [Aquabacterium commune]|uniref:Uncharacterized protein n=1 Tax=Aquabacterium commune TaxID=70586 RepID=A0A4R6RES9_9BURK|nr:hypothetical protein [Aquabacterium commune]TDP84585.1 hypothetical protein EV672_103154 [Aquabacterium commune]